MLSAISNYIDTTGRLHGVNGLTSVPNAKDWQVMYAQAHSGNFTTPVFSEQNIGRFSIMKIVFMSNGTGHFSMRLGVSGGANGSFDVDGVRAIHNNSMSNFTRNQSNMNGWFELSGANTIINGVMQVGNGGGGYWGGRFHGVYGVNNFFDGSVKWHHDVRFTWTGSAGAHAAIRVEVAA